MAALQRLHSTDRTRRDRSTSQLLPNELVDGWQSMTLEHVPDTTRTLFTTIRMLKRFGDTRIVILTFLVECDLQGPFTRKELLGRVRIWDSRLDAWKMIPSSTFDYSLTWL